MYEHDLADKIWLPVAFVLATMTLWIYPAYLIWEWLQ